MKQVFTPLEHLYIDIANHFGKDKETYDHRIMWCLQHLSELEELIPQAKSKASYTAAIIAAYDTQEGIPSGYLCGRDASASGVALLSVLTRCETGMFNTGILDNENRGNIYGKLNEELDGIAEPKEAKDALMQYFYGGNKTVREVFGEQLMQFEKAAQKVAPSAYIMRDTLINSWQPDALSHDWVMPDGFNCHVRVWESTKTKVEIGNLDKRTFTFAHNVNKGSKTGLSLAANVTHSCDSLLVREIQARCNHNHEDLNEAQIHLEHYLGDTQVTDRTNMVSIDDIYSLDFYELEQYPTNYLAQLLEIVNHAITYKPFPIISVHDEFKCHANHVQRMTEMYNRLLWEMYHSDLLFDIIYQITGKRYENGEFNQEVADKILQSEYAIN